VDGGWWMVDGELSLTRIARSGIIQNPKSKIQNRNPIAISWYRKDEKI
jgi:hypothetical protein